RSPDPLSSIRSEHFADLAVNSGAVTTGLVHEVGPFLGIGLELHLGQQIGGLHDGLNGVGEMMSQGAEPAADLRRNFCCCPRIGLGIHKLFPCRQAFLSTQESMLHRDCSLDAVCSQIVSRPSNTPFSVLLLSSFAGKTRFFLIR